MTNAQCSIPECSLPSRSRGWCRAHYTRWQRYGDPLAARPKGPRPRPVTERFWSHVNKAGPIPPLRPELGNCWVWTGATCEGYGQFNAGRTTLAHRFAWEQEHGPIPAGLTLDHQCHTPACVRVVHLRFATNKQNNENYRPRDRSAYSSKYPNVTWNEARKKWQVGVGHHGRNVYGGLFSPDAEDAAGEAARLLRLRLHSHNDLDRPQKERP